MEETKEFKTIEEYIEYLKGLSTCAMLEHEQIHYEFAKDRRWNVEPLKKYLEAARIDVQEGEKLRLEIDEKKRVRQGKEEAAKIVEGLKDVNDAEKIKEAYETIVEIFASMTSIGTEKAKPYVWEDYMNDIKSYDPDKYFRSKLFPDLAFPDGTMSVIGARTSRGKTTALVNLALEAIEAGRRCLFITLEMSGRQLFNKLILLKAYIQADDNTRKEHLDKVESPHKDLFKILKADGSQECSSFKKGEINAKFEAKVREALGFVEEKIKKQELELIEAWQLNQEDIINLILQQEKGTLVLIDYIQRMPVSEENNFKDGYMRVKQISKVLSDATVNNGVVTICGAQFNRMAGTDNNGADKFDDTSFRESGDIEQDAYNAIGIGWENNKQDRFFHIIKARESGGVGKESNLEFKGAYSYMKNTGERYREKNRKENGIPKKEEGKGTKNKKIEYDDEMKSK
jgi:replicative DNA helicase